RIRRCLAKSISRTNDARSSLQIGSRAVGDALRFDRDLAQLAGRYRDLAAEIEAGRAWFAGRAWHALRVEHVDAGNEPPQIRPEAGRKHDGIELFLPAIAEHDDIGGQPLDAATHLDAAIPDP